MTSKVCCVLAISRHAASYSFSPKRGSLPARRARAAIGMPCTLVILSAWALRTCRLSAPIRYIASKCESRDLAPAAYDHAVQTHHTAIELIEIGARIAGQEHVLLRFQSARRHTGDLPLQIGSLIEAVLGKGGLRLRDDERCLKHRPNLGKRR